MATPGDSTSVGGHALSLSAPAKLNLGLAITGRRADGYHELRSVFVRIGQFDELTAMIDADATRDALSIEGDPDLDVEGNLVLRAAALARTAFAPNAPPLRFTLTKRIPAAAGLAGGSSDAIAAMRLALRAWGIHSSEPELGAIALRIGADVPFFLGRATLALITGIGEHVRPLPSPRAAPAALLFTPDLSVATGAAFRTHDQLGPTPSGAIAAIDAFVASLEIGLDAVPFVEAAAGLRDANDLWPAAASLAPGLPSLRGRLERALGRPFLLSGSGTTLFALYPSMAGARDALDRLRVREPEIVAEARLTAAVTLDA